MNNQITTSIRIDEELYEEIKKIAQYQGRSINKQIEYMIKKYIENIVKLED